MKTNPKMFRRVAGVTALGMALLAAPSANAALVAINFAGTVTSDAAGDFTVGDSFSGSYDFDSTATGEAHFSPDFDVLYQGAVSAWSIIFESGHSFTSDNGNISIANDKDGDDRYFANLAGSPVSTGTAISGRALTHLQINLRDIAGGQDMLNSTAITAVPIVGNATGDGSRLIFDDLSTVGLQISEMTFVPIPAALTLFLSAIGGLLFLGRWRRRYA